MGLIKTNAAGAAANDLSEVRRAEKQNMVAASNYTVAKGDFVQKIEPRNDMELFHLEASNFQTVYIQDCSFVGAYSIGNGIRIFRGFRNSGADNKLYMSDIKIVTSLDKKEVRSIKLVDSCRDPSLSYVFCIYSTASNISVFAVKIDSTTATIPENTSESPQHVHFTTVPSRDWYVETESRAVFYDACVVNYGFDSSKESRVIVAVTAGSYEIYLESIPYTTKFMPSSRLSRVLSDTVYTTYKSYVCLNVMEGLSETKYICISLGLETKAIVHNILMNAETLDTFDPVTFDFTYTQTALSSCNCANICALVDETEESEPLLILFSAVSQKANIQSDNRRLFRYVSVAILRNDGTYDYIENVGTAGLYSSHTGKPPDIGRIKLCECVMRPGENLIDVVISNAAGHDTQLKEREVCALRIDFSSPNNIDMKKTQRIVSSAPLCFIGCVNLSLGCTYDKILNNMLLSYYGNNRGAISTEYNRYIRPVTDYPWECYGIALDDAAAGETVRVLTAGTQTVEL